MLAYIIHKVLVETNPRQPASQPFDRDSCDILTKNNVLLPNLYNNYSGYFIKGVASYVLAKKRH